VATISLFLIVMGVAATELGTTGRDVRSHEDRNAAKFRNVVCNKHNLP
jgi:hypothetical protein